MATFHSHPKSKFWSNINIQKPNEVALNSHKKFWFDCGECGHEFDIQLNNVNIGRWCPYCSNKKLCEPNKNCKICFDKCFASVERSNSWSDKLHMKFLKIHIKNIGLNVNVVISFNHH
jgi:DNA-directed RNA polymerase subunit RPC12/RpoP